MNGDNDEAKVHIIWASLTFGLMIFPGIMFGLQGLFVYLRNRIRERGNDLLRDENLSFIQHRFKKLPRKSVRNVRNLEDVDEQEDGALAPSGEAMRLIFEDSSESLYDINLRLDVESLDAELSDEQMEIMKMMTTKYLFVTVLCILCFPLGVIFFYICFIWNLVKKNPDEKIIHHFDFLLTKFKGLEAFYELGPQTILQIYVIFSTDQYSIVQICSLAASIITLSTNAIWCDMLYSNIKDIKVE